MQPASHPSPADLDQAVPADAFPRSERREDIDLVARLGASAADRTGMAALFVLLLGGAFLWSYWPTLQSLVEAWQTEPDYSHGFLVAPIAVWFLWMRRDAFPHEQIGMAVISGLVLLAASGVMRWLAAYAYVDSVAAWSMLVWLSGVLVLFGGFRLLGWALPSVAFLWFMIPMPFAMETALRQPLQRVATLMSCASLRVLGWPAFAEGNTIRMGETRFGVEEACSGLRIFMGIAALAFAYVVVIRRPWWIKAVLLLSVLPITLIANSARIVVTCILFEQVSGDAAQRFSHDMAGFIMIPFAAALFGLLLWYLSALFREERLASLKELVQASRTQQVLS